MSAQIALLGPPSSAKSTLLLQLKHWAASGRECATIDDPSLLVVTSTAGQEVDSFVLMHRAAVSQQQHDHVVKASPLFDAAVANAAAAPLAKCFAEDGFDFVIEAPQRAQKQQRQQHPPQPRFRSFRRSVFCAVKEIGGSMAPLWRRFLAQGVSVPQPLPDPEQEQLKQERQRFGAVASADAKSNAAVAAAGSNEESARPQQQQQQVVRVELPFNRLIFVVDVVSPQHVATAAMELWNSIATCTELQLAAASASTSSQQQPLLRTLVFVNKTRSAPAPSLTAGDVLHAMGLANSESNAQRSICVVVGDTWSGDGIPSVVDWLLSEE